jgi:hypothetical protein
MAARCNFNVIRSDYNVGGVEAGPHNVGPVPVIEGIGRSAVTAAGRFSPGISIADTGVGKARAATSEEGEEAVTGWLIEGAGCACWCRDGEVCGRVFEGCEGDEGCLYEVAKVMNRLTEQLYEGCEGGKVWRSHGTDEGVQGGRTM